MDNDCPLCSAVKAIILFENVCDARGDDSITIVRCVDCGHVFLQKWHQYDVHESYEYYRSRLNVDKGSLYNPTNRKRYEERLAEFRKYNKGLRLLDVGCGQGHFVDTCLDNNYDAMGIELSKAAVELCNTFGLPVFNIDFFSDEISNKKFDIISLFEVIEHVPNSVAFLQRAEELLDKRGLLFLTTPNYKSLDRFLLGGHWRVFNREHINYFSRSSLVGIIKNNTNFEIVYARSRNFNPYALKFFLAGQRNDSSVNFTNKVERESQQDLRKQIERSKSKQLLKQMVNQFLDKTGLGSSITILCQKA